MFKVDMEAGRLAGIYFSYGKVNAEIEFNRMVKDNKLKLWEANALKQKFFKHIEEPTWLTKAMEDA